MRWGKKETEVIKDEFVELNEVLLKQKQLWENYERYLNSIDDADLMERWMYKVLIQKQLYRYIYRLAKSYYEGREADANRLYDRNRDTHFDPSV